MAINHSVDWHKTCLNISNRLSGLTWKKDVAPILNLSIRQVQHKLTGKELNIEELCLFASLFGCTIDDLLVFNHDVFVEPEQIETSKQESLQLSTIIEINNTIDSNTNYARECEIQNLSEFFLYLPLISNDVLKDVCFRLVGNLSSFNRYYLLKQMNYLYHTIPNIPAKNYADSYRDNVLRVKGDGELKFVPDEYSEYCYSVACLRYSNQIDCEKYKNLLDGFKELYCK